MMRVPAIVAVFAIATIALARDKATAPAKPPAPAPRGITRNTVGRGAVVDVRLEGRVVDWTLARGPSTRQELFALLSAPRAGKTVETNETKADATGTAAAAVAPKVTCEVVDENASDEKPRKLVRIDPRGESAIVELRTDIPADASALRAFDLDADGRDDLLLFRSGRVEALTAGSDGRFRGEPMILVDDPEIGMAVSLTSLGPDNDPLGPRLRLPVVGALRTWAPDPARTRWRAFDAPTPFSANPGPRTFNLGGPRIVSCGRDSSGRSRFATNAEVVGRDRLRARLLDPEAAPESRSLTCWGKLPAPERVLDQSCVMLNGAPHLVVTTMSADKLSFFGEKKLRVYPLSPDRSRTGAAPSFAVTTGLNLWQPTTPELADVNGDGRVDLVLASWKGLKDSIVVLEVYTGRADGGFEGTARRTEIEVEDGEKHWIGWGDDANGDGRSDLLVFAEKKLLLLPGTASSDGRKLAASKPFASLPVPDDAPDLGYAWAGAGPSGPVGGVSFGSLGVPAVIDLDGDRNVEVVLAGNDGDGGRVIVFSFASSTN